MSIPPGRGLSLYYTPYSYSYPEEAAYISDRVHFFKCLPCSSCSFQAAIFYYIPFSVSCGTRLLQNLHRCLFMQAFLRRFFRLPKKPSSSRIAFSTSHRMSGSGTAASLYAAIISPASVSGAEPEEAKEKRHHLKDGKGFTNPWVCAEPLIAGYELHSLVLRNL